MTRFLSAVLSLVLAGLPARAAVQSAPSPVVMPSLVVGVPPTLSAPLIPAVALLPLSPGSALPPAEALSLSMEVEAPAGADVLAGKGQAERAFLSAVGQSYSVRQDDAFGAPLTSSEKEVVDDAVKRYGPLVAESEAPALYRELSRHFERLSAAQRELFPSQVLPLNRVLILDSPVRNAFVHPLQERGLRRLDNMVFITTGLLKDMFSDENGPAALAAAITRTAGVLSHELAHPIDLAEKDGFKKDGLIGLQAREIRADAEGLMIARRAGYAPEAVHEGLKRLFRDQADTRSAAAVAAGTHPHDELRLAAQRMLLTLDRYSKGQAKALYPEPVSPAVPRDLAALKKSEDLWRFRVPKNFKEGLERLKEAQPSNSGGGDVIEYNRLILTLDDMFRDLGESLTAEQLKAFIDFNELLLAPSHSGETHPFSRAQMNQRLSAANGSAAFLAFPSHEGFIKKIPAYRLPAYQAWLKSRFASGVGGNLNQLYESLRTLACVSPPDLLVAGFGAAIMDALLVELHARGSTRLVYIGLVKGLSPELKVRIGELFVRRAFPKLSPAQQVSFISNASASDEFVHIFPMARGTEQADFGEGVLKSRMALAGDPAQREAVELYRGVLRAFWEQRGRMGALDIMMSFSHLDWETTFSLLGIDRQAGYSQLRHAVKAFTKTKEYAELLRTIAASDSEALGQARRGYAIGKFGRSPWLDGTMGPFLAGRFNPHLDDALRDQAKKAFLGHYLSLRPDVYRRLYGEGLRKALQARAGALALPELSSIHDAILASLRSDEAHIETSLRDVLALELSRAPLAADNKKALLRELFLKERGKAEAVMGLHTEDYGVWIKDKREDADRKIAGILTAQGVVEDYTALFRELLAIPNLAEHLERESYSGYFGMVGRFKDELVGELRARVAAASPRDRGRLLGFFAKEFLDPGHGVYKKIENIFSNSKAMRLLKREVLSLAEGLPMTRDEAFELFRAVTGSGALKDADAFFERRLRPAYDAALDSRRHKELLFVLEHKRLAGGRLQLEFAQRLLEPEAARLSKGPVSARDLHLLVERLNFLVPNGSLKKDDYLENLAWRLQIEGLPLDALIEDHKSYNWRKANPILANLGSAVANRLTQLSASGRLAFIEYLLAPEDKDLPEALVRDIERALYQDLIRQHDNRRTEPELLRRQAREAADLIKTSLENAVMDATPFERIPMFELLIAGGRRSLLTQHDFPRGLARAYLGYAADSIEEKLLAAFLEVVPAHERGSTMAYLLSQSGENKSSVKNLFEVFQTVGIKFGQMSSTWKLFGEAVARETASLKDNAKPLAKAEIMKILGETLTPEERAKIKRLKRVLGSASVKTVVLAELQDGREAVLLVRRPFAAEQIDSNLRLGSAFLKELKAQGVPVTAKLFDSLMDALRGQLTEEIAMTGEARRIAQAQAFYAGLNGSMKAELGGWRFSVPGLVAGFAPRDHLLVIEKAEGRSFERLPEELKAGAGKALVSSSLRLLFAEGWFDADRHNGNQLLDAEKKIIYPLDFGQATDFSRAAFWKSDDRYVLAQFIRALAAGDAGELARRGLEMGGRAAPAVPALTREISAALKEKALTDRLVAVVGAFAEHGAPLPRRFSFGAMKGLMLLSGEKYVSDEVFQAVLEKEIKALMRRKALPLLLGR